MSEQSLQVRTGPIALSMPTPSQGAIDSWFAQFGGVILGAVIAVGSVLVGAAIAVASGGESSTE